MKSYLYTSRCTFSEFDARDLEIFRTALSHNALVGINGFLHRSKTHYFQCIEGPDEEIDSLVGRIHADHRHSDVTAIKEEQIRSTRFPEWSMGYSCAGAHDPLRRIDPTGSPEDILDFLLQEADRQIQVLAKKKANDIKLSA